MPHPLLAQPGCVKVGYLCKLWDAAWRDQDNAAVFRKDRNVRPDGRHFYFFQVETEDAKAPEEILVLDEYETVYRDMRSFFNGARFFETPLNVDGREPLCKWQRDANLIQDDPRAMYKLRSTKPSGHRAFQIIGHPGIGKTCWLFYALSRFLLERVPVCLQLFHDTLFYFCSTGVYDIPVVDNQQFSQALKHTWLLIDSNASIVAPCSAIFDSLARMVQTTSPRVARYEWLNKVNGTKMRYVMKPITLDELLAAKSYQPYSEALDEHLVAFYQDYGPCARLAYEHSANGPPYDFYEAEVERSLRLLGFEALRKILQGMDHLGFDNDISHSVFLILPGNFRHLFRCTIPSRKVFNLVKKVFGDQWLGMAADMFRLFNGCKETRSNAGYILEDSLHSALPRGGSWEASVMSKDSEGNVNQKWQSHWWSEKTWFSLGRETGTSDTQATGASFGVVSYDTLAGIGTLRSRTYYRPLSPIQSTFDAFVYSDERNAVYILQYTVSSEHSVKEAGIIDFRIVYPEVYIRYVIFTSNSTVSLPVPNIISQHLPRMLHVYVDDIEKFQELSGNVVTS